jgi:hypothetical protein
MNEKATDQSRLPAGESTTAKRGRSGAPPDHSHQDRPQVIWNAPDVRAWYSRLLESVLPKGHCSDTYKRLHPFIEKLLSRLDKREAAILRMRYGIEDGYPKTWREISSRFQLSSEEAHELSEKAIAKLLFILTCRTHALVHDLPSHCNSMELS